MISKNKWWQSAVFYQIYPRSFADGNGDGMGDFTGMVEKLDYLQNLGVDAVWLSPHYPSPFIDCGYDISDYEDVAPEYGDLKVFKRFLNGLHQRGMHLILDLVLNHTSDKHPWFLESRSSLDNPKRDWYIWKKGKDGKPPTNWYSTFWGSAWELDPATQEYYYHFFFKEQPDLNWNNPEVKAAMFNAVRFWLDMGVDGFRLDAVGTIFEDEHYFDHPEKSTHEELIRLELSIKNLEEQSIVTKTWEKMFQYQHDMPGVHGLMRELRKVLDEYDQRVLVGETDDIAFYGNGDDELNLVFNFPLMREAPLKASQIRANQTERLTKIPTGGWPCNTLGNHDSSRIYSRFGDGTHNSLQARLNLTLMLTLKGTPFLYNGEEIGMTDYLINDSRLFRDPLSLEYARIIQQLEGLSEKEAVHIGAEKGRDKCRTPMQWAESANAGFCPQGVTPWLPVNPDFKHGVNVAAEMIDPNSLWNYYRNLLQIRQHSAALLSGDYHEIKGLPNEVFGFSRTSVDKTLIVLLNFSAAVQNIERTALGAPVYQIVIEGGTNQWVDGAKTASLQPYGCVILEPQN
jgi:alpha-glucosidase